MYFNIAIFKRKKKKNRNNNNEMEDPIVLY